MPGLESSLSDLDRLDTGQIVQEFYFLRGRGGTWAVHGRTPDGTWRVESAERLSDAIGLFLGEPDSEIEDLI